jgi:hypothetical protein
MCMLLLGMLVLYMYLTGNLGWLSKVNSVLVILGVLIFVVLYFVASDSAVRNRDKAEGHAKAARGKAEECAMFARKGYRRGCQ